MDWLQTIFNIANLTSSFSREKQLKTLVRQGQSQELIAVLISEMKNEVFKYKQAMEVILEKEDVSAVSRALGMKLLEKKLVDSEISPELFPDFSDKEYVNFLIKNVIKHSNNLYLALTPVEKEEFNKIMSEGNKRKNELQYYIDSFQEFKEHKKREQENIKISSDPYSIDHWKITPNNRKNNEFREKYDTRILEKVDFEVDGNIEKARDLCNQSSLELT